MTENIKGSETVLCVLQTFNMSKTIKRKFFTRPVNKLGRTY